MAGKLNVLIADDSPTYRRMLAQAIESSAPDMTVVGEANDGLEAIALTNRIRPNLILMDLIMPKMGGLEATREIMYQRPTPIVVVSASLESSETNTAFEAVRAGALSVLPKPVGPLDPLYRGQISELLSTMRAMADVRVIHHPKSRAGRLDLPENGSAALAGVVIPRIVAIVSSTGGPAALSEIISHLPADFSLPVVIVQHIAPDFVGSLVGWLSDQTSLHVVIAEPGEAPHPGYVYLAPGVTHLRLTPSLRFMMDPNPAHVPHIPSGTVLLSSVAKHYGAHSIGVVLTGMGDDGAQGLLEMCDVGAFTIAQNEASSVVFGMPREAINLGAARQVLPLDGIATQLTYLSRLGGS